MKTYVKIDKTYVEAIPGLNYEGVTSVEMVEKIPFGIDCDSTIYWSTDNQLRTGPLLFITPECEGSMPLTTPEIKSKATLPIGFDIQARKVFGKSLPVVDPQWLRMPTGEEVYHGGRCMPGCVYWVYRGRGYKFVLDEPESLKIEKHGGYFTVVKDGKSHHFRQEGRVTITSDGNACAIYHIPMCISDGTRFEFRGSKRVGTYGRTYTSDGVGFLHMNDGTIYELDYPYPSHGETRKVTYATFTGSREVFFAPTDPIKGICARRVLVRKNSNG